MCDICNGHLDIYFNTSWCCSDAGYGDTDYGGVTKNMVTNSIICPVCGKLTAQGISQFGSKENALIYLMVINLPEQYDKDSLIEKFKAELDTVGLNKLELILKNSSLTLQEGKLVHSCGNVLCTGMKNITHYSKIEDVLKKRNMSFCSNCGGKLLPFQADINSDIPVKSMEISSEKTWDKGK